MAITSLIDQYELGRVTELRPRIEAALVRVSRLVLAEPRNQPYPQAAPSGGGTPNMHLNRVDKRHRLALAVRAQVQSFTEAFAREVADSAWVKGNVSRTGDTWDLSLVTDNALIREVALSWDDQAGVPPAERVLVA